MMDFICPSCGTKMPRDLNIIIEHTETHVIDFIKKQHPEWVEADGICRKCYEDYKRRRHLK